MAKYSLELRELFEPIKFNPPLYSRADIENWFKDYELEDYLTPDEITKINTEGVWSKDKLARKIVDHFYMREIGFETPALFRHYAKVTMQELMEYYLPLIYSASIKYDPLVNVDYEEKFERDLTRDTTTNSTGLTSGLVVNSDTPQGNISKDSILSGSYASDTSANENNSNITDTGNEAVGENYSKKVKGNSGVSATAQKMILQYRQNIIAIDKEIIEKLQILFMGLY